MKLEEEGAGQRFRIIRPIGEGGMGVVYEAEDRERGQLVALKTLKHRDVDALYRLKREFRALAHLSHPNLVDLHDMVVDGDTGFLTMELVEGTDVIRHCRGEAGEGEQRGRFDEGRLRAVLPQLARALVALHRAGLVHRDIKPSNVLVTHGGRVVVLDFGLVAHLDDRGDSLVGRIVGTVEYIAPEQATDRRAAPSADWYGFGCLLYEALTGRPPHQGAILQVLVDKQSHPPAPPRALVPSVPPDLDALCVDLLAIDPAARPDGAEVLRRLGADDDGGDRVLDPASVASRAAAFAGRELELARLAECARQVEDGGAAVVSIRGPSGIGKTALVRRFLDSVRRDAGDDAVVLEGRCYERETVPYKAIDAVIDQLARYWNRLPAAEAAELLPGRAPLLPRLFPVLGRVGAIAAAPRGAVPSDPHELRQGGFSALRHVLRRLAVKRELIVFLDDLQWSDLDSLRLLADLMRPPDPPAMLLVLCSRADGEPDEIAASADASVEAPVRHAALEQLVDSLGRWLTRIDLARLPPADAAWLAAQFLPGAREGLAAQVAEEAGGVPLFIAELALHVQITGGDEGGPVSFVQLVHRRVVELPDDARELVELVAVSGEPISQRVAATALGVAPESLGRAVRHLRAVNLAQAPGGRATDRIECFHSRIRECVRARIGGERARACHRALALALEQWSEGSSAQLARHWSGAGDQARAGEHARAAADEAARHFDFHRAARFYEMALGAGVGRTTAERRGLRVAMAEALASAGRPAEAAAAFGEAADLADPVTALALRHRSAAALLRGGHVGEGLQAIEAVLRQIEPPPGERRRARDALAARLAGRIPAAVRSRLAAGRLGGLARRWLGPGDASGLARAVGEGDVPGRVLTEMDVCSSMAVALSLVDPHRGAEYQARFLALALRHPEPRRLAVALALEAGYRAGEGRYRRAERVAERAERLIAETGDERLAPYALWVRGALVMTRDSAWRTALDCFRRAAGLLRQQERASSWEMSISEQHVSLCRLALGELGALAETLPAAVRAADLRGDRYAALTARLRFGTVLHLLRGDPGQAARDLDDAVAAWAGQRGHPVGDYAATIARAELGLYTGRPGELGALARLEPTRLARSRVARYPLALRELTYAGGRIAVALGAVDSARGHAALLRRDGAPASVPLARLLDAGLAARAGDRRTAVAALAAALGELERLEMAAHAAAARRALGLLHGAGGRDLVGEADAALRAQGVADPARFAAMMVVGVDPFVSG